MLRALSLTVVVLWHWVFTILVWESTGPFPSSPLAFTHGLWPLTWIGQVMPLFFFVGGFAHLSAWEKVRRAGGGYAVFVGGRFRRLAIPVFPLLAVWGVLYLAIRFIAAPPWLLTSIVLVVSPLWFLGVYLMLVLLAPVLIKAHRKTPTMSLVLLGGVALGLDGLRFGQGMKWAGAVNFIVVWSFCHQLGFSYPRLAGAERETKWAMLLGGALVLAALVSTRVYPASMVGVPGDEISNMGPPTFCMVALLVFQVGLAMLLRPAALRALRRPAVAQFEALMNRLAMPLFLFHTTAYALTIVVLWVPFRLQPAESPTVWWWLERPLFVAGPLLMMVPVLWLFARPQLEYAFDSLRALRRDVPQAESRF